jgi:ribosomal protein S18 acetylase RimI-like enzyme
VKVDKNIFSNNFNGLITEENHCILVSAYEEKIVGYLSAHFHSTTYANGIVGYVDEIVVLNSYRGFNVGKILMDELEKIGKSKKCMLISLATAGAKGFYEKLGYTSTADYFKKYLIRG